jgi:hypothetical protein
MMTLTFDGQVGVGQPCEALGHANDIGKDSFGRVHTVVVVV